MMGFGLVVLGLIIGSFLNVVIYRLPLMLSDDVKSVEFNLCWPRSRCRSCQAVLHWYELIPVLSFCWQKCRCRHCHAKINWQYPIVELAYATLLVLSYLYFGWSWMTAMVAVLNAILLVLWVIDFQQQLLPDALTLSGLWIGLVWSIYGGWVSPQESILSAALAYLLMRSVAQAYCFWRKREGMGGGDMKLMAMLGAWFGVQVLMILIVGVTLALIVSLVLFWRRRIQWQQHVAFGPFLIMASWLWVFTGIRGLLHF